MDIERLEERAVELLGQIQASVGESVRAMNELGALRRREADEAHRQHDAALKKLDVIGQSAEQLITKNDQLVAEIREGWVARIGATAVEAAAEQARQCSSTVVGAIEDRAQQLIRGFEALIWRVEEEVVRVREVNQSLRWKTLGGAALIAVGATLVLFPLSVWWARGLITVAAEREARAEVAGARRLRELSAVDFRDCEVNGAKRLCVRVEQGLPVAEGQEGAAYAVVRGR